MMVVSALLMSDSVIAGSIIGQNAVEGITLVTPVYSLAAFFGAAISLGIPIIYSEAMGEFNKEKADHSFGFGLLMSIIVGTLLFILTTFLGDIYLRSNSPREAVLNEARNYLYWMRFTILLMPLQMHIAAAVYTDGDETLSTAANIVQGIGNIAGSIILSRHMGIRGIGLASFLFNVVALIVLFFHFTKKSNSLRINLYFSGKMLIDVLRFSIIDSSSYLFLSILTAILNAYISSSFGSAYMITISAVALCRELQMIFDGIGEAITPILSVYFGEKNKSGLRLIYKVARRTAILEGLIVTILLIIFAPFVPKVLNITDTGLTALVITEIRLIALGSTFVSLLYLITSYYLVIERISLGLFSSALRDVILSGIFALIFGNILGLKGVFIGMAVAPLAAYIILMIYITLRYGRDNRPLLLGEIAGNSKSYLFDLYTEPTEIIGLQKDIEKTLMENGIDNRAVAQVKLLIEELYMLIREKNDNRSVLCECSIILHNDNVQIITKDEGILFDISKEDVDVTSLTAFAVSSYMEKMGNTRRRLTTMSFNRSSFKVPINKSN